MYEDEDWMESVVVVDGECWMMEVIRTTEE